MPPTLQQRVSSYIGARSLMQPGDRVAVAVSGGADSVALCRVLLELRQELGIVIAIAHFHHGIRGVEADADEKFVAGLAQSSDLELYLGRGDAREYSRDKKTSLEAAARALRHGFFAKLLEDKKVNRIATAHTQDDQAETVLMKVLRGAGTRGLSAIFPQQKLASGSIVRPLLEVRREELREYLRAIKLPWREDQSNSDFSFTRNRVRATVMPLLRMEVNPCAETALAHTAEIAQAEESYWNEQISRLLPMLVLPGDPARGGGRKATSNKAIALDIHKLELQPLAVQRRVVRAAAEQLGCNLDFDHVNNVLELVAQRSARGMQGKTVELTRGWRARLLFRELRLEQAATTESAANYQHRFSAPGQIHVAELGTTIQARICGDNGAAENAAYNQARLVQLPATSELVVRNWRPGDRFRAAQHSTEKRVKELLYPLHLAEEEKRIWPLVLAGDQVVWVRGIDSPELRTASGERIRIEEIAD